ncbi:hypothetical protein FBBNIHIM_23090 [Pseudocitrobacter vendiensis]|uniref:Uncharacterized protein n=1 Tax=Pseudocitrobacter vendiensis TaxID=2488306 RepID=A0ABN8THL4_9ENTR|nr:hypothetical protein FBBNIHIM_23090 [Pseudocitrobacter vendiensis]
MIWQMLAMARYQHYLAAFLVCRQVLNAMSIPIVMPFAAFRVKQIHLAASITICARNATMNMYGNPKLPIIPVNATGAGIMLITYIPIEISKKGATAASMKCANPVLMLNVSAGKKKMKNGGNE